MTAYYFKNPFAVNGDKTAIPTNASGDGSVSYYAGWTPPYQADQETDPDALDVPRDQMNQLFYQITQAMQQYQQYGAPDWITSADNGGTPYAYSIYATVYYGGNVYRNLVADNTATPGTDATWTVISTDSTQVGTSIIWNTIGSPAGRYLLEDGSAVSRTTYSALFNNLCPTATGDTTNASDLITNLASTAEYRIGMKVEGTGIPSGATIIAIPGGTSVQISANATATATGVTIRFFVWGNGDGSTTFNLAPKTSHYIAFAGGSGITYGGETYTKVGSTLGDDEYLIPVDAIPNHSHSPVSGAESIVSGIAGSSSPKIAWGSDYDYVSATATGGVHNFTSQDTIPIVPPTVLVKSFIRY